MVPVLPSSPGSPAAAALPAAGLPAEALHSLARAFGREVRVRLPRLLQVARLRDLGTDAAGPLALARAGALAVLRSRKLNLLDDALRPLLTRPRLRSLDRALHGLGQRLQG